MERARDVEEDPQQVAAAAAQKARGTVRPVAPAQHEGCRGRRHTGQHRLQPSAMHRLAEEIGSTHVGAEMDPSLLFWQWIDPVEAVKDSARSWSTPRPRTPASTRPPGSTASTTTASPASTTASPGSRVTPPGTSSRSAAVTRSAGGPSSSAPCATSTRTSPSTSSTRTSSSTSSRACGSRPPPSSRPSRPSEREGRPGAAADRRPRWGPDHRALPRRAGRGQQAPPRRRRGPLPRAGRGLRRRARHRARRGLLRGRHRRPAGRGGLQPAPQGPALPVERRGRRAGEHVLTEKPASSLAEEVRRVAAALRAAGSSTSRVPLPVPSIGPARDLVADGAVGKVRHVDASLWMPAPPDEDPRWSLELAGGRRWTSAATRSRACDSSGRTSAVNRGSSAPPQSSATGDQASTSGSPSRSPTPTGAGSA